MRIVRILALSATLAFHIGACAAPPLPADPPLPTLIEPGQTQSPAVYAARRAALMKAMGDGVAVIYAEGQDDSAGYRQSSDFLYLTGVEEKGAVLVLAPKSAPTASSCTCPAATLKPNA